MARTVRKAFLSDVSYSRLIQDYLGHRNIRHTVRYTAANPERFEKLWR
jgi:integrase